MKDYNKFKTESESMNGISQFKTMIERRRPMKFRNLLLILTTFSFLAFVLLGPVFVQEAASDYQPQAKPTDAAAKAPAQTLIKNVNIFDGTSDKLAMGRDVLVEGNLIKTIGKGLKTPGGATVIDGGGRTLIPGLIEAHGHFFGVENPIMMSYSMTWDELGARMAERANSYLMKGFTTVRDTAGPVFGLKKAIDADVVRGPRIYPSGAGVSQTSGHGDLRLPVDGFGNPSAPGYIQKLGFAVLADGVPEVQKAVRENFFRGASQIKVAAGGGVTSLADPLDATQYTLEEMKAAVAEAKRYGTYVLVHAHVDDAINQALDAGVICIDHGMLIKEATVKRIAKLGAFLSPQAFLTLQDPEANPALKDPIQIEKMKRVAAGTKNEFKWAKKYGVKVLWGTDMFGDPKNFDLMLQEWLYRDPYFTPIEQLQQATGNNGEMMARSGLKNPYPAGKLGVIEAGAYADMLLIDGDPTKDIKIMTDPETNFKIIMKNGKIYKNTL